MTAQIKRLPKNTIELTLTIAAADVKKAYEELLEQTVKNAEIKGFRKGKAPRALVEDTLDKAKIREEILRQLLPKTYAAAVRDHGISPIMNPKIEIVSIEDGKDWQFKATTCEKPKVTLGDYKTGIKDVTAKSKIVVPGKEAEPPKAEDIFKALLEAVSVEIADIVIDSEVDRLLSHLLSEIKTLGLTLDQYLASTGKTPQNLRDEYRRQAENDLKLEFILEAVADSENITISKDEIDKAVKQVKDAKEQGAIAQNPYMLAQILRRQKTLDFIHNL